MSDSTGRNQYRWLSWGITSLTILWLAWLIYKDRSELARQLARFSNDDLIILAASIPLCALSLFWNLAVFREMLGVRSGTREPLRSLASPYFAGQVIRYLPGKFWGIVYQVREWRDRYPTQWVVHANLDQLQLSLVGNTGVAVGLLLLSAGSWTLSMVMIVATLTLAGLILRVRWIERVLATLSRWTGGRFDKHLAQDDGASSQGWTLRQIAHALFYYALAWVVYLAAWLLLAHAMPGTNWQDGLRICAFYTLAWSAGFAAIIVPGGLGVREAVFVLLSGPETGFGQAAVLAVVVRFWFIAADVVCWISAVISSRSCSQSPHPLNSP